MNKLVGLTVGVALLAAPFISFANSIVSTSAGTGTSISPSAVVVPTGVTQVFSISAGAGFTLSNVTVDGVSQGATNSYSLVGDLVDHSIASFAVTQGSLMPFCSGPQAPGWQVGVAGGGCGGTQVWIPAGSPDCSFINVGGCVKDN